MSEEFEQAGTPKPGRLAERREALGLTQQELAKLLGVELSAVKQWERDGTESASASAETASPDVPRQLPAAVSDFTGRTEELDALSKILDDAGRGTTRGALVISAIGGTAGIGKTALALHWAHQVAHRFPDGQLHVNLRGFDPSAEPVPPTDAIRGFLDALGVPPESIPRDATAQAGLYRSLLADKQMLIVLDNARDEQQVRPLLPASPGSLVLITSRNQITGLAASDGARILLLDTLGHSEAVQMLTARLGRKRVANDPKAVSEIATLCAGLPLALSVVAARVVARPRYPLSALAAELRDAPGRLDALDVGDPRASVQGVFSWSYDQLSPEAARMFRLLGLHPGPDISVDAAACLADTDRATARRQLHELDRDCLITEHVPGRYTFHDLLRAYAARQAQTVDGEQERKAALGRLFDHYAQAACAASILLYPSREMSTFAAANWGANHAVGESHFNDVQQAWAWLEAEHASLIASVSLAAEHGFDRHSWQLVWFLATHLARTGYWNERIPLQSTALAAATRAGDIAGQALTSRLLGGTYVDLRDLDQALKYYQVGANMYKQLGNRLGEAKAWQGIATVAGFQGRYTDAISYLEHELRLQQKIGHKAGEAKTLMSLGMARGALGEIPKTLEVSRQALTLAVEIGNRYIEELAWHGIGYCEQTLGNFSKAVEGFQHTLDLARIAGDRFHEADVFAHLGDLHHAQGKTRGALKFWTRALAIFNEIHHPDADQIRSKLASPGPPGSVLCSDRMLASESTTSVGRPSYIPWCSVLPLTLDTERPSGDTVQLRKPSPSTLP